MLPRWLPAVLSVTLLVACGGDDEALPSATPRPQPTATPGATEPAAAAPSPTAQPPRPAREVTDLFLEPRLRDPDRFVSVPARPPSPFQSWDRESVVVYDLEEMTERNFGPGRLATMSPDETRLAYNLQPQVGANQVRIVDLQSGELLHEFEWTAGLAGFTHDDFLFLAGGVNREQVYDLRRNEVVFIDELDDSSLEARFLARTQPGRLFSEGRYRLNHVLFDGDGRAGCQDKQDEDYELCRAEALEQWTLEDASGGDLLLAFRAYKASPAGPGELVIATSPQCVADDSSTRWCPEVLAELRADDPEGEFPYEEAQGTSNIFILDIETGEAEFIATATFTPDTRVTPENWPLIANEDYVVWTESYCSLESPGNTRIFDRATGEIMELDASLWVEFTPTGDLGVDPFGPRAILDIETLNWNALLPEDVIDVGQSSSGRYLYIGGVLGHGGLCG